MIPFFLRLGYEIGQHYNPADFMIDRVKGSDEEQEKIIQAAKELFHLPSARYSKTISHLTHHGSFEHDHDLKIKDDVHEAETNTLWSHHESFRETSISNKTDIKGLELRVVVDPSCDKSSKVYNKVVNDDDSGRSSWTENDRSSTITFSSSLTASTEEIYFGYPSSPYSSSSRVNQIFKKWPTSFWTQFKILTERNFFEGRRRLLSKLNWIQTIGLGLISGLIWFQVARTENTINDIRGWMFFSTSYWMLFALFGALVSIPSEKEVISKERASGSYRLSSYYLAKMAGELPITIALPTVFHLISYPLFSFYSVSIFLLQWIFLILNSIVAQSIGFVIGVTTGDLKISVTISALYSVATNLFAGFYSSIMPSWLSYLKYASIVHYAFQNMQVIEFTFGPPIT